MVDVEEAQAGWEEDSVGRRVVLVCYNPRWSEILVLRFVICIPGVGEVVEIWGRWLGSCCMDDDRLAYSRRTEKANTTIAFNPNLMRRDHTSNKEMLKMKISNAVAVISTPLHRIHWSTPQSQPVDRVRLDLSLPSIPDRSSYHVDALLSMGSVPRLRHSALKCCGEQAYQTSDDAYA